MTNNISIASLDEFSVKLGIPKHVLTNYIFQADQFYKTFRISKSSGRGQRVISAPSRKLKGIQKWIKIFILDSLPISINATGYRKGLSIKNNAWPHINKEFVCGLDIQDFFPSVTVNRVYGLFKSFGYSSEIASALAKLTTFKGELPQGAPSSPSLSNLILEHMDIRIAKYCIRPHWSYTRYCDDLTISGNGNFPPSALKVIQEIVESEGFQLNQKKTRIRRNGSQQVVTGLVVNSFPNLTRQKKKSIRALFHQASIHAKQFEHRFSEMEGTLAFYKSVRPHDTATIEKYSQVLTLMRAGSNSSL